MQTVGHHEYFSGLEREVSPPGVVHILNACTGLYRVKGRRNKRNAKKKMLAHKMTSLISNQLIGHLIIAKQPERFPYPIQTPSFNEQAEPAEILYRK